MYQFEIPEEQCMHVHSNISTVHLQYAKQLVCVGQVEGVGCGVSAHPQGDGDGGHYGDVSGQSARHDRDRKADSRQCFGQSAHEHCAVFYNNNNDDMKSFKYKIVFVAC